MQLVHVKGMGWSCNTCDVSPIGTHLMREEGGERGGEVVGDDTLITGKQKVCRLYPLVLPVKAVAA